jgi:hypothetical protein
MASVDLWSIIFNLLLNSDIFSVEFTCALGHETQVYSGVWTISTWWMTLLHGTLVLQPTSNYGPHLSMGP